MENEFVRIAKELGLRDVEKEALRRKESLEEIDRLTAMKFKIVTKDSLRKKLKLKFKTDFLQFVFQVLLIGAIMSMAPFLSIVFFNVNLAFGALGISGIAWTLIGIAMGLELSNDTLGVKNLEDWGYDIPVGALYAVQEAKEKLGINEFSVYYPKAKNDPVIIGLTKHKHMVEIFSWDNGEKYD